MKIILPPALLSILLAILVFLHDVEALETEGIIGGSVASPSYYRHLVSIQIKKKHVCGGTIIGKLFVITAAHCVTDKFGFVIRDKPITVVAGIQNIHEVNNYFFSVGIAKIYIPKEFIKPIDKSKRTIGDIAVLRLLDDLPLNPRKASEIRSINIPQESEKYKVYRTGVVGGFGISQMPDRSRSEKRPSTDLNREGQLYYITTEVFFHPFCGQLVGPITEKHICARAVQLPDGPRMAPGTCFGDEGGSLVNYSRSPVLIGVLSSTTSDCDETAVPAIYTKVAQYLDMINAAMDDKVSDDARCEDLTVPSAGPSTGLTI